MKLTVPKNFTGNIMDSDGKTYQAGKDGTVTIPDAKIPDNLWGYGFVVVEQTSTASSK
jgi:hypothetical protein